MLSGGIGDAPCVVAGLPCQQSKEAKWVQRSSTAILPVARPISPDGVGWAALAGDAALVGRQQARQVEVWLQGKRHGKRAH